jgi:hypothetical protein
MQCSLGSLVTGTKSEWQWLGDLTKWVYKEHTDSLEPFTRWLVMVTWPLSVSVLEACRFFLTLGLILLYLALWGDWKLVLDPLSTCPGHSPMRSTCLELPLSSHPTASRFGGNLGLTSSA